MPGNVDPPILAEPDALVTTVGWHQICISRAVIGITRRPLDSLGNAGHQLLGSEEVRSQMINRMLSVSV